MSRLGVVAPLLERRDELRAAMSRLHTWYRRTARALPWRQTRDPYAIWVSEAMLQQTQVATVIPYYERWMARFPDLEALAAAEEDTVLLAWEGLGYYRRARNLLRAARILCEQHGGLIPRDVSTFRALPGVGPYTAAAVLSIAHDVDLAVLDGNVKRVLGRLVALEEPLCVPSVQGALEALARELLPAGTAALHNQALMELGALVCSPRRPRCADCPLADPCLARAAGDVERFPPRPVRRKVPRQELAVAVVLHRERLLLYRRPCEGLLAGLWDLPAVALSPGADGPSVLAAHLQGRFGLAVSVEAALPVVEHAYTHLRVTLYPHLCAADPRAPWPARAADRDVERWVSARELVEQALPRASHKVLESLYGRGWSVAKS